MNEVLNSTFFPSRAIVYSFFSLYVVDVHENVSSHVEMESAFKFVWGEWFRNQLKR